VILTTFSATLKTDVKIKKLVDFIMSQSQDLILISQSHKPLADLMEHAAKETVHLSTKKGKNYKIITMMNKK